MDAARRLVAPTELVYVPEPSAAPFFLAAGLLGVFVGLFSGIVVLIVGAVVSLLALRAWVGDVIDQHGRLPRRQRVSSSVLAAVPPRRHS